MADNEEYFGSPERIALARRSASLWRLLRNDRRYAYYGRLVALSDPGEDTADILQALAKLQGAAVAYFYPASAASGLFAQLEERELVIDRHEHYWGGEKALAASHLALQTYPFPADLKITVLGPDASPELVREVAELCQSCEVMPVPGSVMRGQSRDGICLVATDKDGRAVASASSYVLHHPASPRAKDVFWGMLATRNDRRGEKIALLLGAQAIIHMWEHHWARGFMTGVRSDNPSSQALCNKLGVIASDWIYASCMDREVFAGKSITK
jgi:hypothetical protein